MMRDLGPGWIDRAEKQYCEEERVNANFVDVTRMDDSMRRVTITHVSPVKVIRDIDCCGIRHQVHLSVGDVFVCPYCQKRHEVRN